jgi:hypothetical protein
MGKTSVERDAAEVVAYASEEARAKELGIGLDAK